MTGDAFRELALALDGAIEASHMGHPDFRANGRIFATLRADERTGMVKLTPEQQAEFLREHPGCVRRPRPAAGAARAAPTWCCRRRRRRQFGRRCCSPTRP